jgi:hypothetical protein
VEILKQVGIKLTEFSDVTDFYTIKYDKYTQLMLVHDGSSYGDTFDYNVRGIRWQPLLCHNGIVWKDINLPEFTVQSPEFRKNKNVSSMFETLHCMLKSTMEDIKAQQVNVTRSGGVIIVNFSP